MIDRTFVENLPLNGRSFQTLINMRVRARQLNGTFELDSGPGRGTTVRVTIPFRPAV